MGRMMGEVERGALLLLSWWAVEQRKKVVYRVISGGLDRYGLEKKQQERIGFENKNRIQSASDYSLVFRSDGDVAFIVHEMASSELWSIRREASCSLLRVLANVQKR